MSYWPFWLGSIALAGVALAFLFATGSLLGVSSSYKRIVAWRATRELEKAEAAMPDDAKELEAMLRAATLEQFGEAAVTEDSAPLEVAPRRLPLSAHIVFLVAVAVGATLSAALSGSLSIRWDLGSDFAATFGSGWPAGALLILGGGLVGFGTAMAGGCTSGHGLSGCGRLQPGSLVATATFFGTGILVSILLSVL